MSNKVPSAAVKLKIYTVWEYDAEADEWNRSWSEFHRAWRTFQRSIQQAMGEVLITIRDLHAQGKTRFATKAERERFEIQPRSRLPKECYPLALGTARSIDPIFQAFYTRTVAKSGLQSAIYAQAQKIILDSEFKKKLAPLLRGETSYPVLRPPMPIHNNHWRLYFEEREVVVDKETGETKIIEVPVCEVKNLFPGGHPIAFEAWNIRGRGAASKRRILEALASGEKGWKQGTLSIQRRQRPGQKFPEYFAVISYKAPAVKKKAGLKRSVIVFHRGISRVLHAMVIDAQGVRHHSYYGHHIVQRKLQFSARRRRIQQDLATRSNGRGRTARGRAMGRLAHRERDAVSWEVWQVVKWAHSLVDEHRPSLILMESFGSIALELRTASGYKILPYLRSWPFYQLKKRFEDVLRRRSGIDASLVEVDAAWISKTCPLCEHVSAANVAYYPKTSRVADYAPGQFRCEACAFTQDLDATAVTNMVLRCEEAPDAIKATVKRALKRLQKSRATEKAAAKSREGLVAV